MRTGAGLCACGLAFSGSEVAVPAGIAAFAEDTATSGIGENAVGEAVNLPQTGNNSLADYLVFTGALLLTITGAWALYSSRPPPLQKKEILMQFREKPAR